MVGLGWKGGANWVTMSNGVGMGPAGRLERVG